MKRVVVILSGMMSVSAIAGNLKQDSWTWLHQKKLSTKELEEAKTKHDFMFSKQDVQAFTQLMFSWNAFRPSSGHFTFYVQVRDARHKTWGVWHKMAEWGAGVQRSFASTPACNSKYLHVRLEANAGHVSDAFKIRVHASKGASLAQFRALSVSLSNFNNFKESHIDRTISTLPSTYVANVPKQSQFKVPYERNDSICSPTSVCMLIGSLTDKKIEYRDFVRDFVRGSFDAGLNVHGSWPFNMAHAFEQCKGNVHFSVGRLNSFTQLHERLKKGVPVVVSVRGHLNGAPKVYDKGHLLLVIGWDAKKQQVICHDPAFKSNHKVLKRYNVASFLRAWDRSNRLAYLADPIRKI